MRASRVRFQRTVIRGSFGPAVEMLSSQGDLILDRAVILCGAGPVFRMSSPDTANEHRICLVNSVVSGPGPIVEQAKSANGAKNRPLLFLAYGSTFGRLQVPGIASVLASSDAGKSAAQQVDWAGDQNQFAGWKGFFARGSQPTILVDDLAGVRSTWSATEKDSLQILQGWPGHSDLAALTPKDIAPFLPPERRWILATTARPGTGLFEKTAVGYQTPIRPEPIDQSSSAGNLAGGNPGDIKSLILKNQTANPLRKATGRRTRSGEAAFRNGCCGTLHESSGYPLGRRSRGVPRGPGDFRNEAHARTCRGLRKPSLHAGPTPDRNRSRDTRRNVSQYRASLLVAGVAGHRFRPHRATGWSIDSPRRRDSPRSGFPGRKLDLDGECPSRPVAKPAHRAPVFGGGERRFDCISSHVNATEVERSSPPFVHDTGRSTGLPDL